MDAPQLISFVQEYEELYNVNNPNYSNQQIRDSIWAEIGERLNYSGHACKERWTRIRDNHRKALNLRKTKSGRAASKIKPPKFYQELSFLTPYLKDEERRSNLLLGSVDNEEIKVEILPYSSNVGNDVPSDSQPFTESFRAARKKSSFTSQVPQGPSAAQVLQEYLARPASDPLLDFFLNMGNTVKTFPVQDQIRIKDHVVFFGRTEQAVYKSYSELEEASVSAGLIVSQDKTKYNIVMTRGNRTNANVQNIPLSNISMQCSCNL